MHNILVEICGRMEEYNISPAFFDLLNFQSGSALEISLILNACIILIYICDEPLKSRKAFSSGA